MPWVPRNRESRPEITSATMRPCRFAGPASATRQSSPVMQSVFSTASPTAKMSGSLVRIWSSTRMPPSLPTSMPAISASAVSGFTPIPRITMSAGYASPDAVRTSRDPSAASRNPDAALFSRIRTPFLLRWRST